MIYDYWKTIITEMKRKFRFNYKLKIIKCCVLSYKI